MDTEKFLDYISHKPKNKWSIYRNLRGEKA
jgi:hypothetical protein